MSNQIESNNSQDSFDEEYLIDFSELWRKIKHSWRLIVGVTLFTTLVAFALTFVIPKKWEADATLQEGRYPVNSSQFELIEDPAQTVERLRLREFKETVLSSLGLPVSRDIDSRSDLFLNSLSGASVKGTDFINLSVHAYSKEDAVSLLTNSVALIEKKHEELVAPVKNRLSVELQDNQEALLQTTHDLESLKTQMAASGVYKASSPFAPSIVAINMMTSKDAELRALKAQKLLLETQLARIDASKTKIINKIKVINRPVFPKLGGFLGLGIISGLLLSLLIIFVFRRGCSDSKNEK